MSEWIRTEPPEGIMLDVLGSDYMGEWTTQAMRKDYKKPKPGQCKKGFRKGWRWVDRAGERFDDVIEGWKYPEPPKERG